MKIINFRGDLTDNSAKKEALLTIRIILDSLLVNVQIHVQSTHHSLQNERQNHIQIRFQFQIYSDVFWIKTSWYTTPQGNERRSLLPLAVLLFFKLNKMCFGYFEPETVFLDNENN